MTNEAQDIDKLELLTDSSKRLVAVGEKIMSDSVVDWKDAAHAPEAIDAAIDFVKALKAYREIMAEVKDIDALELARIGGMILGK